MAQTLFVSLAVAVILACGARADTLFGVPHSGMQLPRRMLFGGYGVSLSPSPYSGGALSPSPSPIPYSGAASPSPLPSPYSPHSPSPSPAIASPSPREEQSLTPTAPEATCAGVSYDGFLSSCTVFFDVNGDGAFQATEPAVTVRGGLFTLTAGLTAAQLGDAHLLPAPRSVDRAIKSDKEGVCYDRALQRPNYLPLAAPAPSSCNSPIVISPLTTVWSAGKSFGLTAADLKAALGLPSSVALGTANVLQGALDGDANALRAYIADMSCRTVAEGLARLLSVADASFPIVASASFKAIAKHADASLATATARRLRAATMDLGAETEIAAMANDAQQLAAAIDASSVPSEPLDPAVVSAAATALANLNNIIQDSTSAADVQKAGVVLVNRLGSMLEDLASGDMSPQDFSAETTPEKMAQAVAEAKIPGVMISGVDEGSNKAVAIGVGVGVGLGVPLVAAAGAAFYFHSKNKGTRMQ